MALVSTAVVFGGDVNLTDAIDDAITRCILQLAESTANGEAAPASSPASLDP